MNLKEKIHSAIVMHIDWVCEQKKGRLLPDDLTESIMQQLNFSTEYAKDLATFLWEKLYKHSAPEWEPLDDLEAVLTQIDNMISYLNDNGVHNNAMYSDGESVAVLEGADYLVNQVDAETISLTRRR